VKLIKASSEESPRTTLRLFFAREILARVSSGTETTQLLWSYELCKELRNRRYDETAISTGATSLRGLSRMLARLLQQ